jgi:hypothetical protein
MYLALTGIGVLAAVLTFVGMTPELASERGGGRALTYFMLAAAFVAAFPVYFAVQRSRAGGSALPQRLPPNRAWVCVAINAVGIVGVASMIVAAVTLNWPVTPEQGTSIKLGTFGYLAVLLTAVMNEALIADA